MKTQNKIDSVTNPETVFTQGYIFYEKGDYKKAMGLFERALEINSSHYAASVYLAVVKEEQKKIEKAKKEESEKKKRKEKTRKKVQEAKSFYRRGKNYYEKGEFEKAIDMFNHVLKLVPKHKQTISYMKKSKNLLISRYYNRGFDYYEKGKLKEAIPLWKKILIYIPNDKEVQELIAKTTKQLKEQNIKKAKEYYDKGLTEYVDGNIEEAGKLFSKSLEFDPDNIKTQKAVEKIKALLKFSE